MISCIKSDSVEIQIGTIIENEIHQITVCYLDTNKSWNSVVFFNVSGKRINEIIDAFSRMK